MKKIYTVFSMLSVAILFVSCLKDPKITEDMDYGDEGVGAGKLIDIPAGTQQSNFIDNTDGEQVIDLAEFRYANDNPASEDITIELELDQNLLDDYNEEMEAENIIPPSTMYSLVNEMKVVIPKGGRSGFFQIKVKPSDFLGGAYAFPLKIKSVTPNVTVNQLRNNVVVAFGTKNEYDGVYISKGYFYHPSGPRDLDEEKNVVTAGANSVIIDLADLGASNYKMLVTINSDNTLTITTASGAAGAPYIMYSALPAPYTGKWPGSSMSNNTYDPATKTFYIRVGYSGGTRVSEEEIVYKEPR